MSVGFLQSIISSSFPNGLLKQCIAIAFKETLYVLSYPYNQGLFHRHIKAGNILMDLKVCAKLVNFGVFSSLLMHTNVTGTPYQLALEVVHYSHIGYSFKVDIWSFGIIVFELAHGKPPLSHLPPSKSLIKKIKERFRVSNYKNNSKKVKSNKFSKAFNDMVASYLDQDPTK